MIYDVRQSIISSRLQIFTRYLYKQYFQNQMGNNSDKNISKQPQPIKPGAFITPQELEEIVRSSIDGDSMKPTTLKIQSNHAKGSQRERQQSEQDSSQEEGEQRVTTKDKRVLRILKNILGEENVDSNREQILIDIIQNKGEKGEEAKAEYKKIYEDYLKQQQQTQQEKNQYFFKMVEKKVFNKGVNHSTSQSES